MEENSESISVATIRISKTFSGFFRWSILLIFPYISTFCRIAFKLLKEITTRFYSISIAILGDLCN